MGQYFSTDDQLTKKYEHLESKYNKLLCKYDALKKHKPELSEQIDRFVDKWYDENHKDIDIGQMEIAGIKFDIMPDELEKHIYKKSLKIMFSFLHSTIE